jgi:hypothetical protein
LKFKLNGRLHYGWARVTTVKASACNGGPAVSATLTGFAYETIPGKSLKAGQTKKSDDTSIGEPNASLTTPTPEPATLGALAMGAPALSLVVICGEQTHTAPNHKTTRSLPAQHGLRPAFHQAPPLSLPPLSLSEECRWGADRLIRRVRRTRLRDPHTPVHSWGLGQLPARNIRCPSSALLLFLDLPDTCPSNRADKPLNSSLMACSNESCLRL